MEAYVLSANLFVKGNGRIMITFNQGGAGVLRRERRFTLALWKSKVHREHSGVKTH